MRFTELRHLGKSQRLNVCKQKKSKIYEFMTHNGLVERMEVKPCNYSQELISIKKMSFFSHFSAENLNLTFFHIQLKLSS